jgi:hypothetical protein
MKIDEISNCALPHPIEDVPDRAPHDQADRHRLNMGFCVEHPHKKKSND